MIVEAVGIACQGTSADQKNGHDKATLIRTAMEDAVRKTYAEGINDEVERARICKARMMAARERVLARFARTQRWLHAITLAEATRDKIVQGAEQFKYRVFALKHWAREARKRILAGE